MRNLVAKHNFHRSWVHEDKSKLSKVTIEDGMLDYYQEQWNEKYHDNTSQALFKDLVAKSISRITKEEDKIIMRTLKRFYGHRNCFEFLVSAYIKEIPGKVKSFIDRETDQVIISLYPHTTDLVHDEFKITINYTTFDGETSDVCDD